MAEPPSAQQPIVDRRQSCDVSGPFRVGSSFARLLGGADQAGSFTAAGDVRSDGVMRGRNTAIAGLLCRTVTLRAELWAKSDPGCWAAIRRVRRRLRGFGNPATGLALAGVALGWGLADNPRY